jgi:hypothetical protein
MANSSLRYLPSRNTQYAQSPLGEGTSVLFEVVTLTQQSISDFRLGQGN